MALTVSDQICPNACTRLVIRHQIYPKSLRWIDFKHSRGNHITMFHDIKLSGLRSVAWTMNSYSWNSMLERHTKHALALRLGYGWSMSLEAIRLHGQIANVEVAEATRASELEGLKERNVALEGQVAALESLALSYDELSIKASPLKFEKDKRVDQMSKLEGTCFELRDEVSGYKLFKEQIEVVQDVQELYPCFLTTIAGRRWILSCRLRLMVIKCLQSPKYLAALGGDIGRAIDKGMQSGLTAEIDHGKAGRGLTDVAAYDPFAKANYISVVSTLHAMNFPLLAQLESHKDSNIADIMGLLYLEGPIAEASEAGQLQPSPEQLMLPIHRLEDQVVIRENSLSFSLDVANARV
uniref:Transposase (Putative), gypsy type n=1 Tax=Tanacetum cinerariifolium TaxID=118510 RepID=A0A699KCK0_TANCI|nr:hypothetical protein [Tanacetum cinerariifolium]